MRCATARKRLSDALDGALRPGRKPGVEAHMRICEPCRSYRDGLVRIQAGAALPDAHPPGFWAAFERGLDLKLAAGEAGRAAVAPPLTVRRRLAWAAAAAMVLAGAGLWYALLRPQVSVTEAWVPYEDVLGPLVQAAEADPELAAAVDREVRAAIDEMMPAEDADAVVLSAADPLFWEGLSDDELRDIVTELEDETGRGGPL